MKLTTKGRYAVTAMVDLAKHEAGSPAPVALSDIACRQDISIAYLEQLFAKLRRNELINSVRGVSGGYRLARPADEIMIADIVGAVDERIQTTACSEGHKSCRGTTVRCVTHELWDELGHQISLFLQSITVKDVLEGRVRGVAAVNAPLSDQDREGANAPLS